MKRILYTLTILMIFQSVSFATVPSWKHSLNGYWHSHHYNEDIKIAEKHHYIKVKNLFKRGWEKYYEVGHRRYEDHHGNILKIYSNSNIVATRHSHHYDRDYQSRNLSFYKEKRRKCRRDYHRSDWYGRGNNSYLGSHYEHSKWNSDGTDYYTNERWDYKDRPLRKEKSERYRDLNMEGTWISNSGETKLRIHRTQEGIKVKLIGKNKWHIYIKDSFKPNTFVNNKGNKYIFDSDSKLIWRSINGHDRFFTKR